MIVHLNFDVDAEGYFCIVVTAQTENGVPLMHTQGFKLDSDPIKSLLKLSKGSPIKLDFANVIATASDESIAQAQAELAAQQASQPVVEDSTSAEVPSLDPVPPAIPSPAEVATAVEGEIVAS